MFKSFWNHLKVFWQNIKNFFNPQDNLSSDSFDEVRNSSNGLRNQAHYNSMQFQDVPADDPTRLYNYYNSLGPDALTSLANKQTEGGITGQQAALNEMSLDNQRRQYAFQVQGMQEAGLNPALMYESGATNGPASPAATQGISMSMSDLLQAFLIDKQRKLLDAQARNTDADTDYKKAETENMSLINKYYPEVTDTQIKKMLSDIGFNEESVKKMESEVNLNNLEAELKRIDKIIKSAEARESSPYFKARRELEEAKTETEKAHARQLAADALMKEIEAEYEKNTNTKMSSSSLLAIASALGTIFSNSDDFSGWFTKYIYDKHSDGWIHDQIVKLFDDYHARKYEIAGAARGGGER